MENTIILILIAAGMFAIIGGITIVSHIYNLNEIKSIIQKGLFDIDARLEEIRKGTDCIGEK